MGISASTGVSVDPGCNSACLSSLISGADSAVKIQEKVGKANSLKG